MSVCMCGVGGGYSTFCENKFKLGHSALRKRKNPVFCYCYQGLIVAVELSTYTRHLFCKSV